jgi:C1A family cysteine protease
MARQLDGFTGDTGAFIRSAMKALRLFGAPPERYWPYVIEKFDDDPSPFAFALAQNWQALKYYRIDTSSRTRPYCLNMMKELIVRKLPVVLGFRVFSWGNEEGEFPLPDAGQSPRGGHAVMACGFDDDRKIGGSKGAFLIRNSWGTGWGNKGYGWLPYGYVLLYLSSDFWTLVCKEVFMG